MKTRKRIRRSNPVFHVLVLTIGLASCALLSCASDSSSDTAGTSGPGAGISQGGAQDFGLFRDILQRGEIPGVETLDEVGFFNEHKIELPPAGCGENVCLHGFLGVMGNMITGSNCTMVLIGMNTPLDPANLERPPLDVAIAVDISGSMNGDPIRYVREGLSAMLSALEAEDRVTLITYETTAEIVVSDVDADSLTLRNAIDGLSAGGNTNIYEGLRLAFEALDVPEPDSARQRRVILLSDGLATTGLTNPNRIIQMAEAFTERGIGLSTIGVGADFDVQLMQTLSESGAGNFYFLEDPLAVVEVFTEEVNTFLVPIAEDVTISVDQGTGYILRRVHGTRLWDFSLAGASINIPSLFVAGRTSTDDNDVGRRGGGGGIVVELLPRLDSVFEAGRVTQLTMDWTDPETGDTRTQTVDVNSSLVPGDTPESGFFSNEDVEKAFVTLNIFVGFELATQRAENGALTDALRVLQSLRGNVANWLDDQQVRDEDIEDDLQLIDTFIINLQNAGALEPPPAAAPEPWLYD